MIPCIRFRSALALAVGLTLMAAPAEALQLKVRFGGLPIPRDASKPVDLELTVTDDEGGVPSVLLPHHEKTMHLVAVPEDLSEMVHIHPVDLGKGRFKLPIRDKRHQDDRDNSQAVAAFARPGRWWVFAEVSDFPDQTVLLQETIVVPGRPKIRPMPEPLVWAGDVATTSIALGQADATATWTRNRRPDGALLLTCRMTDASGEEIGGFLPWLGMTAHGVLVGKGPDGPIFRHLHPEGGMIHGPGGHGGMNHGAMTMDHGAHHGAHHGGHHDATVQTYPGKWTFVLGADDAVSGGVYRFWLQTRVEDGVRSLPFTLKL